MIDPLLGGLSPRAFLARHWQKKPLLVRGALPSFRDPVSVPSLMRLATRDAAETRLVARHGRRWTLAHGPFAPALLDRLPPRDWTLLVQGLNHFVPAAERLLARFAFVPWARLDDVMVSYAAVGGGVGPHVDSYDVFLVQGRGRRRWRISRQRQLAVDPRAPLKILKGFRAEEEWVLAPGDLLYLPPGVAHEGTALEPCTTYSIGFRAPSMQELGTGFLAHLQEHLALDGRYSDPDLAATSRPGQLADTMIDLVATALARVRWTRADVARFLGAYLSEPKPHVLFARPRTPLAARAFATALARRGARLAGASILLYRGAAVFINGERIVPPAAARTAIVLLADRRKLPSGPVAPTAVALLYTWYRVGYVLLGADDD